MLMAEMAKCDYCNTGEQCEWCQAVLFDVCVSVASSPCFSCVNNGAIWCKGDHYGCTTGDCFADWTLNPIEADQQITPFIQDHNSGAIVASEVQMFKGTQETPIPAIWYYTFLNAECEIASSCNYWNAGYVNTPFSGDHQQLDDIRQSYPKGAYDIISYIDFSDMYKPKWDNSRPFKVSFLYTCYDHFGMTFTKQFKIEVKCLPDSKIVGSPPEDLADGVQDDIVEIIVPILENIIACVPFSEFGSSAGGEGCLNQYKVLSTSLDFPILMTGTNILTYTQVNMNFIPLSLDTNNFLGIEGDGNNPTDQAFFDIFGTDPLDNEAIYKRSGIIGYNGKYEVCLKDLATSYLIRDGSFYPLIEFDILAQANPNIGWNHAYTKQIKFLFKLVCGLDSGRFVAPVPVLFILPAVSDFSIEYHGTAPLSIDETIVQDIQTAEGLINGFKFKEFWTFVPSLDTGCPIESYQILQLDGITEHTSFFLANNIYSTMDVDKYLWANIPDTFISADYDFKIRITARGGHTQNFPTLGNYKLRVQCWEDSTFAYNAGSGFQTEKKIQRTVIPGIEYFYFSLHKTNYDQECPLLPDAYQLSTQENSQISIIDDPLKLESDIHNMIQQPCDISSCHFFRIKTNYLDVQNKGYVFYLRIELKVQQKQLLTYVPFSKYVVYTYKIDLGCGIEILNPIGVNKLQMVYKKRTANLNQIIHNFHQISDNSNQIVEPLLYDVQSLYKSNNNFCKVYKYELWDDKFASIPYSGTKINILNQESFAQSVNDPWSTDLNVASPSLQIDDLTFSYQMLYISGKTYGEVQQVVELKIWVCGHEKLIANQAFKQIIQKYKQKHNEIKWDHLYGNFTFSNETEGNALCEYNHTQLYKQECNAQNDPLLACTQDYLWEDTHLVDLELLIDKNLIQTQKLHIYTNTSTEYLSLFVQSITHGEENFAHYKIHFQVCGLEKVHLVEKSDIIIETYEFEQSNTAIVIKKDDYEKRFRTTNNNCPPYIYELLTNYTGRPFFEMDDDFNVKFLLNRNQEFEIFDRLNNEGGFRAQIKPVGHAFSDFLPINITLTQMNVDLNFVNKSPTFAQQIVAGSLFLTSNEDFKQLYYANDFKVPFDIQRNIKLPPVLDDMNFYTQIDINFTSFIDHSTNMNISYSVQNETFKSDPDPHVKFDPKTNQLIFSFSTIEQIVEAKGKTDITITLKDQLFAESSYQTSFNIVLPEKKKYEKPIVYTEQYQELVKVEITDISDIGIVAIRFNTTMIPFQNLTEQVNNSAIDIYIAPSNEWHLWDQNFQFGKLNFTWLPWKFENQTRKIIEDNYDFSTNSTNRTIKSINETVLLLNITFLSPAEISPYEVLDLLIVNIHNKKLFKSTEDERLYNHELDFKVRRQMDNSVFVSNYKLTTSVSKIGLIVFFVVNFILTFLAPNGMQYFLSLVNCLQLILHFPIFNLPIPANAMNIFETLIPIVGFDVLQIKDFADYDYLSMWLHPKDEDLDQINIADQVILLGYDSHNPILNLGLMTLFMIIYLIKVFFVVTILQLFVRKTGKGEKLFKNMLKQVFFQEILIIFIEGYIELLLAAFIYLNIPEINQDNRTTMYLIACFFALVTIIVIPCLLLWVWSKSIIEIRKQEFIDKWGMLFQHMKLQNKLQAMMYFFFVLRRLLFLITFRYLENYPAFQIILLNLMNLGILIYQGSQQPQDRRHRVWLENINEYLVITCSFHLMFYSDWVPDKTVQYCYGWSQILFIVIIIIINMWFVFYHSLRGVNFLRIKLTYAFNFYFCTPPTEPKQPSMRRFAYDPTNEPLTAFQNFWRVKLNPELNQVEPIVEPIAQPEQIEEVKLQRLQRPMIKIISTGTLNLPKIQIKQHQQVEFQSFDSNKDNQIQNLPPSQFVPRQKTLLKKISPLKRQEEVRVMDSNRFKITPQNNVEPEQEQEKPSQEQIKKKLFKISKPLVPQSYSSYYLREMNDNIPQKGKINQKTPRFFDYEERKEREESEEIDEIYQKEENSEQDLRRGESLMDEKILPIKPYIPGDKKEHFYSRDDFTTFR